MKYSDFDDQFSDKSFIMFWGASLKCTLSWKSRLAFGHLSMLLKHQKGDTLIGIARSTGLERITSVKTSITELSNGRLVEAGNDWTWYATQLRLDEGIPFLRIFKPKPKPRPNNKPRPSKRPQTKPKPKRESGCPLTALDNIIMWQVLKVQRKARWVWYGNRHKLLAEMVGCCARSVRNSMKRLQDLKIADANWEIQIENINPSWYQDQPNKVHMSGRERLIKELVPDDIEPLPPLTEEELFLDEIRLILGCHLADDTARALIEQVRQLGIVVHAGLYLRTKIDQKLSSHLRKHRKCSIEDLVEIIKPSANGQIKPSANGQIKPSANGQIKPSANGQIKPSANEQIKAEPPASEVAEESFYKIDLEEIWRNAKDEESLR